VRDGSSVSELRRHSVTAAALFAAAVCLLIAVSFPTAAAAASRPAAEQEKIDWLLLQVRSSDATFIRNGSEYTGAQAASHLKTKLFFAGKRVQTAKNFIIGVATHSEESGQPYEIRQKGTTASAPLGIWLLDRLTEHEKPGKPAPQPTRSAASR
jgi:hypothetical protein